MANDDGGSLQPGFSFYFVSYDVADNVVAQRPESDRCHVQIVPSGQDPYTAAGHAGSWLGSAGKQNISGLLSCRPWRSRVAHLGAKYN